MFLHWTTSDNNMAIPIQVSALDTIASKLNMKSPRYYFYRSCADFYDGIDCNCSYESYTVCHVTSLSLQNHHLSGQVPRELADLPYLEVIELSGNQLYGLIPESLGNLSKLVTLDLSSNLLFGSIPERLGNMQSLKTLSLGPNRLSGPIPNELGNITTLQYLGLRDNNLSGDLPQGLGSLRNLESFLILSNNVTGELPRTFADLTSLRVFSVIGNSLSGRIPDFIQNWTQLNSLTIMGNNFEGPLNISTLARLKELWVSDLRSSQILFPPLSNLKKLKSLILRNCSITGQIPAYIGNFQSLRYLDLSFNNLTGEIPNSISTLSLTNAYFTRNMLNGSIPGSFPQSLRTYWNLFACCSPTTFNTTSPLKIMNEYCPGSKMSKYNSLYINCGGEGITIDGNYYEEDDQTSDSYVSPNGNWAYSRSGYVIGTDSRPKDYIRNMKCGIPMPDTSLYATSRLSPLSLKYHGLCLQNGNYKVKLHFAETLYKDNKDYSILGKRIFDVYIQGNRVLKDFNIIDESKDPNKVVIKEFLAVVMNHTLEIHFYWAGKGSIYIPPYLYGPLISAISVIPDFELHKRGVSTFAKTTIAVSSFALLLFVSVSTWKMSGLEQKKLDGNVPINIGGTSVTFKDIVQATQNFSPKMEIGGGDFGTVYKAEMKEKGITIVKKLSPNLKQGINEIKNEINSFSSLKHENLVQTLGAFSGDNQNLLLNEYMENDSLSRALFDPQSSLQLSWPIRYNMCLGIAKGLNYLHQDSRMKIVHRGIKATNILLDKFLKAKISDFGLAKLFDGDGIPMPTRGGRR
ncbi:hypothetical protein HHK36_003360 [Tetracentron sinense]|uniref:non-specific serine/threonine protein kinase n=1 Tax=Tetracentron sinense TaxID=13715 RepID=A0A835DNV4_TETSI|nr:hypothetical protein HHK36_003360 [Tetracentron sinense]